ncbi:HAMP domain-containing protein [Duganella sp. BJB488]|uniref:methyl-accepting chemotaxis protein n=1 Tax=unclassified Duganella TaxID=2636909 RepID=UPI000E347EC6|nr:MULTISPECIES: methyl-accepting chemotaxis protein [unclassified Duganella]RFP10435.1 HAMP domain-containing protein [Duganella sp. BJB489]RFP14307.1 HAMP domain-containing protein [Duganella sp. BJB488]RFP30243.1 HAMP domain-containing protein [Duganella sp. BJB480]
MLNDLSIKQKLYLGFSAILAIILALLSMAYIKFNSLSDANGWDRHSMEVIQSIDKMRNDLLQVQVEARGYYLSGTPVRLESTHKELRDLPGSLQAMQTLVADSPNQSARFKELETMIATWTRDVIESQLAMRQQLGDKPGAADAMGHNAQQSGGNVAVHGIYKLLDNAAAEERRLLAERSDAAARLQETMRLVLSGGGLACVALSALIAWALGRALLAPLNNLTHAVGRLAAGEQSARAAEGNADELGRVATEFNRMAQAIQDSQANELAATNLLKSKVDSLLGVVSKAASGDLTGKIDVAGEDAIGQLAHGLDRMFENLRALLNNVQKAGIQVTTSATEIAASARQQEATGIEQAQTSVEILSTTKEISANTSQLLKTMEDATAVADYTTNATADAQTNLRRMDSTMQHMVSATDSINAKLAALSEKASNINSVLITITKVADQTNILSLNAAIEAEKAGEAGRGFSVVATEIRRLADQTSVSTWDIEQMLKEMQSAVSASVMGMDKFSEEIRRSVGEVRQVTDQLSGVMDQVQKLAPQFDAVLQGMQSQAVGAQQISETMMQLNDATQQTVESLKATSEAVHQLQYAAGDLQTSVANFAVAA